MLSIPGNAHLMDLVLLITVVEALLLTAYHRLTGRGLAPADYLLNLLAGLCLMLALRCALTEAARHWMWLFLMASGVAHGTDLSRRWRQKRRALDGPASQT